MLLKRKNLHSELLHQRNKTLDESTLMHEIHQLLIEVDEERAEIQERLHSSDSTNSNAFCFDLLESGRIFHLEQIRKICVDYRLRFLDSDLFKGDIPAEAISEIRSIEKAHNTTLSGFKIVAPSKLFKLKNYDDPLLFAPIGNGYYYLIHKWGNDLNAFRKWMVYPLRSLEHFVIALVLLSLIVTPLVPVHTANNAGANAMRVASFLFILKSFIGIAIYYCFWQGKSFNEDIWKSKYYNH